MLKKILSLGVYPGNSPVLNRKIRTSNLIALSTILILSSFSPLFLYFMHPVDLLMFTLFYSTALLSFFLVRRRKYYVAFTANILMAYLYFIWAIIAYGWEGNLQFYLIVMCMIVVIFYDKKTILKLFLLGSAGIFFGLLFFMRHRKGLLDMGPDFEAMKQTIGYINLLVVFGLVSILILFFKNENLTYQEEITGQKKIIEEKNKEMTDSINYAQRLQNGLLPSADELTRLFPQSFLYYSPKDIVSGDFYWFYSKGHLTYIACGDCTGHGVPGALMSVLGINLLNEIVENGKASDPAEILELLRAGIIRSLNKDAEGEYKDGMDLCFVCIDTQTKTCYYAGANNPLYHYSAAGLQEYKADKQPVGYSAGMKPFTTKKIEVAQGDFLVLFTDGYADQFGGPSNKKFTYKSFRQLLGKIVQGQTGHAVITLDTELRNWRGSLEQIDDVCVVGIRV